jgi:Zn-finger protein
LEDVAEQQEDAEEEAEVDKRDEDAVGEHPTVTYLPCHMWEAPS